jgi:hypothetical protein
MLRPTTLVSSSDGTPRRASAGPPRQQATRGNWPAGRSPIISLFQRVAELGQGNELATRPVRLIPRWATETGPTIVKRTDHRLI